MARVKLIKENFTEDTMVCSKVCFKKAYGKSLNLKK